MAFMVRPTARNIPFTILLLVPGVSLMVSLNNALLIYDNDVINNGDASIEKYQRKLLNHVSGPEKVLKNRNYSRAIIHMGHLSSRLVEVVAK